MRVALLYSALILSIWPRSANCSWWPISVRSRVGRVPCRTTPHQIPDPQSAEDCLFSVTTRQTNASFADLQSICARNSGTLATYHSLEYKNELGHLNPKGATQILLLSGSLQPSDAAFWKPIDIRHSKKKSTVCRTECPNPIDAIEGRKRTTKLRAVQAEKQNQLQEQNRQLQQKLRETQLQIADKQSSVEHLKSRIKDLNMIQRSLKTQASLPACPNITVTKYNTEWTPFQTGCFLVIKYNMTFDDAVYACRHQQAQLAQLHDGPETRFVKKLVHGHSEVGIAWASRWWFERGRCNPDGPHCRCPATYAKVQWRPLHCERTNYAVCQLPLPQLDRLR